MRRWHRIGARASRAAWAVTADMRRNRGPGIVDRAHGISEIMARLCEIHQFRAVVSGALPSCPAVVVANHLSYIDPVVLCALVPSLPISKAEVSTWPMLGAAGEAKGVLFVERASAASRVRTLRKSLAALRAGGSVLNFPEGTTTDGSVLLPFKRGIFGVARIARVPIVPVTIGYEDASLCWTGNAKFVPHYLDTAARAQSLVSVHFGAPIMPRADDCATDLARRARAAILSQLGAIDYEPAIRVRVPAPRSDAAVSAAGR